MCESADEYKSVRLCFIIWRSNNPVSAGQGRGEYGERSWRSTRDRNPPLRISETDYFRGQHHEIPAKMVVGNPDVGGFSRCEACHRGAEQGDFDEHGVRIPGYGRWDD